VQRTFVLLIARRAAVWTFKTLVTCRRKRPIKRPTQRPTQK
jgi:hypothetical protein